VNSKVHLQGLNLDRSLVTEDRATIKITIINLFIQWLVGSGFVGCGKGSNVIINVVSPIEWISNNGVTRLFYCPLLTM